MPDKQTIDVYSKNLESYLSVPLPAEQIAARQTFVDRLQSGAFVLDFGAGPGVDSCFMLDHGLRVRALDATPEFVKAAQENGVDAHLGTFDDLTEVDTYDGVYASFSLLHAPRSAFAGYISAIHRALKPNGTFFLGLKLGTGEHRDDIGRIYTYFERDEIEETLKAAGFENLEITTGFGKGLAGAYQGFILVICNA